MELVTYEEKRDLAREIESLFSYNDYGYSRSAIDKILNKWIVSNPHFITAFKSHPDYVPGKFMIVKSADFDRKIDKQESYNFSAWLKAEVMVKGKETLPSEIIEMINAEEESMRTCGWEVDVSLPNGLMNFLGYLADYAERTVSEDTASRLNAIAPNAHIHAGEKTSRAVNKLCTYLGYNKHPDYNKEFAKYADSLSPLKITRHTVLSINPLDYLLMSNGNSWSSCHSIINKGCYSSGTISYMLDGTSMVFYTVDSSYEGNDFWDEPKINRQMFHFGEEKLVQGRLYPQSNDCGSRELYDANRAIVQQIVSELFNFPNRWKLSRGTQAIENYVYTEGTHYADYEHFEQCTLSRVRDSENVNHITIGHDPICIECGGYHDTTENINCCHGNGYYCTHCGEWVDDDDTYWSHGDPYCGDCVTWCECCDEYECNDDVYYITSENRYVCEYCFNNYYVECLECGEYHHEDDVYYIESENGYVCNNCFHEEYTTCYECGEYVRNDDVIEHNGNTYCEECFHKIAEPCCNCGCVELKDDMTEHDGKYYCDACYESITETEAC